MRRAAIGGIEVSVVGLGCNNLGRALDLEQSKSLVGAALDLGVDYFDTASNYGEGNSEAFLGEALAGRRHEAVVATKFGVPVPGWEGSGGASPDYVRQCTERSLRGLQTDYIDLLMIHFPDPETPIEDTLGAMAALVEEGKVREVGCSNFTGSQLDEAIAAADAAGLPRLVCDQVHYSMVHRDPETDGVSEACGRHGIALLPYYPLASGLLTGKTRRGQEPQGRLRMDRYQEFLSDENFDLVERLAVYAGERDLTMVQVALGWLLSRPAVPAVTAGATSVEQLKSNVASADWAPSTEDLAALETVLA